MKKADIQKTIDAIRGDFLALAKLVLEDDTISNNIKIGENTLADSDLNKDLTVFIKSKIGDDVVLDALFNHYVVYLEWDRPPEYGKRPPINALRDWAVKRGIDPSPSNLWAISNAIWQDGHKGRPIFATIDKELDGLFADDWSGDLFESITSGLDAIFNE